MTRIRALGCSQTEFDPRKPGRLCRGRERWIEPFELEKPGEPIHRLVFSGAQFTNDSAADAHRGVNHSGVELAGLIAALFPRKELLAFMEDGHPADIPADAVGVEAYEGYRAGGRTEMGLVRWRMPFSGVGTIRELLGDGDVNERVRGFVLVDPDVDDEVLAERLFLLVGMSTQDSPPAMYQPSALPEVLELCSHVVLLHRDKHGPVLGVYSRERVELGAKVERLCEKAGTLLVPFAIPPMLARWDRALHELRAEWDEEERGPFPVPESPPEQGWQERRRRRRDRGRKGSSDEKTVPKSSDDASDSKKAAGAEE